MTVFTEAKECLLIAVFYVKMAYFRPKNHGILGILRFLFGALFSRKCSKQSNTCNAKAFSKNQ